MRNNTESKNESQTEEAQASEQISSVIRSLQARERKYTGFKDRYNNEYYEGSLIYIDIYKYPFIVLWNDEKEYWMIVIDINKMESHLILDKHWEDVSRLVGNIADDKELLENTPANFV